MLLLRYFWLEILAFCIRASVYSVWRSSNMFTHESHWCTAPPIFNSYPITWFNKTQFHTLKKNSFSHSTPYAYNRISSNTLHCMFYAALFVNYMTDDWNTRFRFINQQFCELKYKIMLLLLKKPVPHKWVSIKIFTLFFACASQKGIIAPAYYGASTTEGSTIRSLENTAGIPGFWAGVSDYRGLPPCGMFASVVMKTWNMKPCFLQCFEGYSCSFMLFTCCSRRTRAHKNKLCSLVPVFKSMPGGNADHWVQTTLAEVCELLGLGSCLLFMNVP